MPFATADSLTSSLLLQDLAYILLGALAVGILFHAIRRLVSKDRPSRQSQTIEETQQEDTPFSPLDESIIPLPPTRPAPLRQPQSSRGVDASHFTWWDFLICATILSVFLIPIFFIGDSNPDSEIAIEPGVELVEPDVEIEAETKLPKGLEFLLQLGVYAMLASMVISMIQWVGMRSPSKVFGLGNVKFHTALIFILIGASLAILSINAINYFSIDYINSLIGEVEVQAPVKELQESENPLDRVFLMISAVIVAPVFEELVFRGYFYGILKKFTEPMFAAFISGGIFALIHGNIPAVLPLWFFGIFLSLAYEASRSLWVPIGIHAVFNCTTVFFILYKPENETAAAVIPTLFP